MDLNCCVGCEGYGSREVKKDKHIIQRRVGWVSKTREYSDEAKTILLRSRHQSGDFGNVYHDKPWEKAADVKTNNRWDVLMRSFER